MLTPACLFPGDELEYIRPNVYRNIARQLNISLHSETVVTDAFLAVAAQIFTAGTVSWQICRQGWAERKRMEPPLSEKACFWDGLQGEAWFLKGQVGGVSCFSNPVRAPLCLVVLAGKCPGLLYPPDMLPLILEGFSCPSSFEVALPHCTRKSLIPSSFAHHWQLEKVRYMGVSFVSSSCC